MHSDSSIQGPAVAGLFYPADPHVLAQDLDAMLAACRTWIVESENRPQRAQFLPDLQPNSPAIGQKYGEKCAAAVDLQPTTSKSDRLLKAAQPQDPPEPLTGARPRALIVPHAGYIYSGPVAATAYALLKPIASQIRRVLLLGPAHRLAFSGIAWSSARAFRTPLGDVPQDKAWLKALGTLPFAHNLNQAFAKEHCLEVQLPFLQRLLNNFSLLPILVGQANPDQVAQTIALALDDPDALIIVTTDLSHYHSYDQAKALDAATNTQILGLNHQALGQDHACGRLPVSGLLITAKAQGWRPRLLDLRNSGDTLDPSRGGSKDSVVGYGAYAFA